MRKALVFLSCGQRDDERKLAKEIERIIEEEFEMDCYNADSVHGFDDVMSITNKLSVADYYLFVDFKRKGDMPISVFTHQEFALARAWGIDQMLAFQEKGLKSHGMLGYVLAHPVQFTRSKLLDLIREQIRAKGWDKNYSRNLWVSEVCPTEVLQYKDHAGESLEKIWHVTIENRRSDRAAVNTVVILHSIQNCTDGIMQRSEDRSYLKWAYQTEYQRTILPQDSAVFDAFAVRVNKPGIFLHSARDFYPRESIVTDPGKYIFTYHVYSDSFPLLTVRLSIDHRGPLRMVSKLEDSETTAEISR